MLNGWDFVNNDSDPTDDNGHGTEMAGIIASTRNDGIGYAGVSQSKILPIKSANAAGRLSPESICLGLDYAVSHNAKIISMSFTSNSTLGAVSQHIADAYSAGCLLVAAAGNDASNQVVYPAGYDNVLGVSAIGPDGQLAWFSNYGSHVDFAAPGVDIGTTYIGSTYNTSTGTSPATAMVSGMAALVWSQNPTTLRDRIITYMVNPAYDYGDLGRDDRYGYGVINAYGTVTYGIMLVAGTGSIWVPNTGVQCYFDVPAATIIDTIMVGNENADFNIYLKWNYPPTPTSYDAASLSGYSLEHVITTGVGRLYIVVYSNSGTGNFKLCSISGAPTDGNFAANTLQEGYGYYTGGQGWGKGYAFNSGPDNCNFDLAIKWNQIATPTVYDAKSETFAAQEIVGPVYGTGNFYSMVYSQGGSGEFAMLRLVY
jgi:serine protease